MPMLTLSAGEGVIVGKSMVTILSHRRGQVVVRVDCEDDVEVHQVKKDGQIKSLRNRFIGHMQIKPLTGTSSPS
jgi:sRNA-binding carbon storage regulator CsrA